MVDKQRELEAFMLVEVEGAKLKAYLDGFGDKMDVLGMGTEGEIISPIACTRGCHGQRSQTESNLLSHTAVSKVVEHWQNVFRATHLALGESVTKIKRVTVQV